MDYILCQVCSNYVDGLDCPCGWKQPKKDESEQHMTEVPTELLMQIIENWKDSTYYCEAIEYLQEYVGK